jgi:hypothetical protein
VSILAATGSSGPTIGIDGQGIPDPAQRSRRLLRSLTGERPPPGTGFATGVFRGFRPQPGAQQPPQSRARDSPDASAQQTATRLNLSTAAEWANFKDSGHHAPRSSRQSLRLRHE